jgi:hypothetical protein
MTDPETHRALHHLRGAELRAQADEYRLTCSAKRPQALRTRLGWTLVEVGLRLVAPPQPALAPR